MQKSTTLLVSFVVIMMLSGLTCTPRDVIRPFTTDMCSGGPEGPKVNPYQWCPCCLDHDVAYWQGGTRSERREADRKLKACIEATGEKKFGSKAYHAVRIFGSAWFPYPWRWGYGWRYPKAYHQLSAIERDTVDSVLKRVPIESVTDTSCGR